VCGLHVYLYYSIGDMKIFPSLAIGNMENTYVEKQKMLQPAT